MVKKRIIILGAGLTGLSAAWHLQKKGIDCKVFEKEPEVGGLCRSQKVGGFIFDCDGHLLHFKHRYTFNLVKKLLGENLAKHQRNALVYSHNKYIPYPFQANLKGLPTGIINECIEGLIKASKYPNKATSKKGLNFLEWINKSFGNGIAKRFMIPYNTKFWTVQPKELTCEWLDGFIPVPTLSEVIKGARGKTRKRFGYNVYFWYPKTGGISELPLALSKQISNVYTDSRITKINLAKKEVYLGSGKREKFDYLISTIPLPELPDILNEIPQYLSVQFRKLRWNSIFNLNLGLEKRDNLKRHWVYFSQDKISFFRVGYYHNFSSYIAPSARGSLYAEVSYSQDKPINRKDTISQIKNDLRKVGILNGDKITVEHKNDIKYGYPIYDNNYNNCREKILEFLLKNRIISCGRYGSWRYMSMEGAILEGKNLSESYAKFFI